MHPKTSKIHRPVLLRQTVQLLRPNEGESYLDLTAGYGGHASEIIAYTHHPSKTVLVDRDAAAIDALEQYQLEGSRLIHDDYESASVLLRAESRKFDMILADIGVSSLHLDRAERGFSFQRNGPLDMRMDQRRTLTAAVIVNTYEESEIAKILKEYGEEPRAKRIASMIVKERPFESTTQLADAIKHISPQRFSKLHPATKSFQALRIAVNDELGQLERSIPLWIDLLSSGGRLAIISFHSLEDRIVKKIFAAASGDRYDAICSLLTKNPVVADADEIVFNPRARSAKLRAVVKK